MAHGFEVFIDEAGCSGFKFRPRPEPGSPEWFILSAVVWRTDSRAEVLQQLRLAKDTIAPDRKDMHFRLLSHDQKVAWIDALASCNLACSSVLIEKPQLQRKDLFAQRDRLYFYGTRLLLERVSWLCRDHHRQHPSGDGRAKIHFSKRKAMSYDALKAYLGILRGQAAEDEWLQMLVWNIQIHWPALDWEDFKVIPHMDLMGLQAADGCCGAMRAAVEYTAQNFTEHRFVKMLRPVVYVRGGNYLSYGVKFFPNVPQEDPMRRTRYHWLHHYR